MAPQQTLRPAHAREPAGGSATARTGALATASRRSRLIGLALACGAALAPGAALVPAVARAQAPAAPIEALPVSELAPGVFVHTGRVEDWLPGNGGDVANLGFVVGTRCVAVIDTGGTPRLGERLRAAVARQTALPVCYVIHTHAHPDHVLGGAAFRSAGTQFVAAATFNAALSARAPFYLNALQRDFGIMMAPDAVSYATLPVRGTLDLDLGERILTLTAWRTAHTDNDLTVLDRRTRTLFLSDLLFAQHIPVLDGNLRGWLAVMQELAALDVALAVPGHGPASTDWPAALNPQRQYLDAVLRETRAAIKARVTLARAVERIAPEPAAAWQLGERFHRRNVTAAYAELEWED
jgi:quinoprotein relay system zinc metallohydrolase 2